MEITLEQALELITPRIVHHNGVAMIKVDDLKELKKELAAASKKNKPEEEEKPKTMDQARMLAIKRLEEADLSPTGTEAVKS